MTKSYALDSNKIKTLVSEQGSCLATDRITVDGRPVGYMYRERVDNDLDSGWRFFAGDETDEYANNPENIGLFDVNTIANYDPAIIPLLSAPVGSAFMRKDGKLVPDNQ